MQSGGGPGDHTAVGLASWINAIVFVDAILVVLLLICKSIFAGNRSRSVRYLQDNTPLTHCSSCVSGSGLRMTLQNGFAGVVDLRYLASMCNETGSPMLDVWTEEEELYL